jgi:hypothetical protein
MLFTSRVRWSTVAITLPLLPVDFSVVADQELWNHGLLTFLHIDGEGISFDGGIVPETASLASPDGKACGMAGRREAPTNRRRRKTLETKWPA